MTRKTTATLLALLLALSVAACGGTAPPGGGYGRGSDGDDSFQKNLHQSKALGNMDEICGTGDGFYFVSDFGGAFRLYFMDRAAKKVTLLCPRPDCGHDDGTCAAAVDALSLWAGGGRLYFARSEHTGSGDGWRDLGKRVYSQGLDGTGRREVMSLELGPIDGRALSSYDPPICHRGVLYFVYNGAVYSAPLGGGTGDARRLWGEDYFDGGGSGGYSRADPNMPRYTLWADGDTVYFMVNRPQPDGTQRDTLYACDIASGCVAQVWETPRAAEFGDWETTGVSVSSWYVTGGRIYFYLSGGDLWRSDLATGETVRLAETRERTRYGTAIFSDGYMCLLNDSPIADPVTGGYMPGFPMREGGDTFFVYTLEGQPVRELEIGGLLEDVDCWYPVFIDGDELYFAAGAGGGSGRRYVLYCAGIGTGEINLIYEWKDD